MIEKLIDDVVSNPTDDKKNEFLNCIQQLEYSLLVDAESLPFKSREYFDKRTEAFSVRGKYAKIILKKWIAKFNSTEGCPLKYEDTLNIPFRSIKKP